jgi:hypothetical protein
MRVELAMNRFVIGIALGLIPSAAVANCGVGECGVGAIWTGGESSGEKLRAVISRRLQPSFQVHRDITAALTMQDETPYQGYVLYSVLSETVRCGVTALVFLAIGPAFVRKLIFLMNATRLN